MNKTPYTDEQWRKWYAHVSSSEQAERLAVEEDIEENTKSEEVN